MLACDAGCPGTIFDDDGRPPGQSSGASFGNRRIPAESWRCRRHPWSRPAPGLRPGQFLAGAQGLADLRAVDQGRADFRHQGVDPAADLRRDDWQQPGATTWTGNAKRAERMGDPKYGAEMLEVEWAADQQNPVIEVTTQVQAQNRSVRPGQGSAAPLSDDERKLNLMATACCRSTAWSRRPPKASSAARPRTSTRRARSTNGWSRTPSAIAKTRGCGVGDVSWMIKTGNLNGKCADLNALYVAHGRSVGVPARDVYGIRVVPSEFGYKSLGAGSRDRHQGAALPRRGLARRQRLDAGRSGRRAQGRARGAADQPRMTDPKVVAARKTLFGAWEGNWLAFNIAHDVKLPGAARTAAAVPDVPAGGGQAGPDRPARSGRLQVHDHGQGTDRLSCVTARVREADYTGRHDGHVRSGS